MNSHSPTSPEPEPQLTKSVKPVAGATNSGPAPQHCYQVQDCVQLDRYYIFKVQYNILNGGKITANKERTETYKPIKKRHHAVQVTNWQRVVWLSGDTARNLTTPTLLENLTVGAMAQLYVTK